MHCERRWEVPAGLMVFCWGVILCTATVFGQAVPADREVLLKGEGAGQGVYADQHGYPGPKHVLDLAKELKLSEEQKKSIQNIFNEMNSRAKEVGQTIVNVEEEMNDAFANGLVTEKSVRDDSEEIGRLRGRLRAVHLVAHMKTQKVLNGAQIAEYKKLRTASNAGQGRK